MVGAEAYVTQSTRPSLPGSSIHATSRGRGRVLHSICPPRPPGFFYGKGLSNHICGLNRKQMTLLRGPAKAVELEADELQRYRYI